MRRYWNRGGTLVDLENPNGIFVLYAEAEQKIRDLEADRDTYKQGMAKIIMERDELLAALEQCVEHVADSWDEDHPAVIAARTAIKNAKEPKP